MALLALAALVAVAASCGVRPNNLRSPPPAPAAAPATPAGQVPPAGAATAGPERSTTSRGPFPPSADGPDAGL